MRALSLTIIHCCNKPSHRSRVDINFEKQIPNLNHLRLGKSVELYKGNHIAYDENHMMIGNIKSKRYKYLQKKFCDYYNIDNVYENECAKELWLSELTSLISRHPIKKPSDIYHYTYLDMEILKTITSVLNIKTLINFNALNIPLNLSNLDYVSKYDIMYGSVSKVTDMNNTYIKCSYSSSNIMKYVKRITDSMKDNDKPIRHVMSIPIINEKTLKTLKDNTNFNHMILAVIPNDSIYLNTSDHWFHVQHVKILNKYPIAICMFYNEASLLINPIKKVHFEQIEDSINKNIIPGTCEHISLPDPPSVQCKESISPQVSHHQDIIFTDASVKRIDDENVSSIGIWYGPNDVRNMSQKIISEYSDDINYCELVAIYIALINSHIWLPVVLYTDSLISLKLINDGLGNLDDVKNIKYKPIVSKIVNFINSSDNDVHFMKVKAHEGYIGNENADTMARMGLYKEDKVIANNLNHLYRKCKMNMMNQTILRIKNSWF